MFNLESIENDWKRNSFCLTDEEILSLFQREDITTKEVEKELKEKGKELPPSPSTEERLFVPIFKSDSLDEKIRKYDESKEQMYESITQSKGHLSKQSQKVVVEGCMDVVFDCTRYWENRFEGKVATEQIYYICLEALLNAAKYCTHYSTKSCFRLYVRECIKKNIIKQIARWEHISYHNAYCIIEECIDDLRIDEEEELKLDYVFEEPLKPSVIYERMKDESYEEDYIARLSSEEFMREYNQALEKLPEGERMIMHYLFDNDGNCVFTQKEISEFLGIKERRIGELKRKILTKLRNDNRFDKYRIDY